MSYNCFYVKAGLFIPLTGITTLGVQYLDVDPTSPFTGQKFEIESEVRGQPAIGFTGTVGYEYKINEKIGLYGEAQFISLSIKSKSSEYTSFSIGGTDYLSSLAVLGVEKKVIYQDELSLTEQADASKDLTFKRDFSSFGINIGVKYKF